MIPNPGSDEAVKQGCLCPRMDNGFGRGVYQDDNGEWQFWINADCKLHGGNTEEVRDDLL